MGIDRCKARGHYRGYSLPHTRGDGPFRCTNLKHAIEATILSSVRDDAPNEFFFGSACGLILHYRLIAIAAFTSKIGQTLIRLILVSFRQISIVEEVMKRILFCLSMVLSVTLLWSSLRIQPAAASTGEDTVRIMIQYKNGQKKATTKALAASGAVIRYAFDEMNVLALTLPAKALEGLSQNPNFLMVEKDPARYPIEPVSVEPGALFNNTVDVNGQIIPWGIDAVQARDVWDVNRDAVIDSGAPTGAGKKVCVIDTGYYTDHEDLKDEISGISQVDDNWQRDGYGHGTHVAGTISALNNTAGVVGITPGTVDLYIVKIFSDEGKWVAGASDLIAAAYSCTENGAKIINMSLGGDESSSIEEAAFQSLFDAGILSIAAAGNLGTSAYSYPASYSSIISVAAVNSNLQHASFSQYNNEVDLSGPGVSVISTVPVKIETIVVDGVTYSGYHIQYSAWGSASGELVNGGLCDAGGAWAGKIVLCERGSVELITKVTNVQTSGGLVALIYNNEPGVFAGTLGDGNSSVIPALTMSQADGQFLIYNKLGATATVTSTVMGGSKYESWSGTSMAAPHVAGAAALAWSCKPEASNIEIRDALFNNAYDLGTSGRDDYYGYGLVQSLTTCYSVSPTAVELVSFSAQTQQQSVLLTWETASELDTLGFNLFRASSENGKRFKLNDMMIRGDNPPGSLVGSVYEYSDAAFSSIHAEESSGTVLRQALNGGRPYFYWLEEVDIYGHTEVYGPVEISTKQEKH